METEDSGWLDIMDYAQYRGVSVSTIRRYIKGKKVKAKFEDGKYYIFSSRINPIPKQGQQTESLSLKLENETLRTQNKKLRQEIEEMKMLLHIYEERMR